MVSVSRIRTVLACLVFSISAGAQVRPSDATWSSILAPTRAIDWSTTGVTGGIPTRTTVCATIGPYDGPTDTINTAIANCPSGQVVLLSAGTFNLTSGIVFANKSDVTLRGAGPDQTLLRFSAAGACTGVGGADVCLMTAYTGNGGDQNYDNAATWTGGYSVGTTSITLGSATTGSIAALQVGSQIFLDQLDDASDPGAVYVCSAAGVCSTSGSSRNGRPGRGQVEPQLVTSISGTGPWTIGISPGIRMPNISAGKSPQAWWDNGLPIQNDGIENLTIDDTPDASCCANGIFILNGRNNWIKNIRSVHAAQKHVWLYQTTHTTIRDSYFYGAVPTSDHYATDNYVAADNLTENNIFQHIGFPIMNEGCIGCVGAYNYTVDDYYTGTPVGTSPEWQQASSYQHSVGDAFILWEGNQGLGMTSDDVHGTSNFGTAFRNYWNGRDMAGGSTGGKTLQTNAVILNSFNRFYNLVGNVLGTAGYHNNYTSATPSTTNCDTSIYALGWGENCSSGAIADDTLVATTLMRWGNYDTVNNAVRFDNSEVPTGLAQYANPVPATQALPGSLYLDARPPWFGNVPWPPIGPDVTGGDNPNVGGHAYKIPAQLCFEAALKDANGILTNFNSDACYVPDLTITASHSGNFKQGQSGAAYTITVSNASPVATTGAVNVMDSLPSGLLATAIGGTGWTCTLASLSCSRSDALATGSSYPAITLTVNVANNAPASLINTASVSGGGELNTANDTASDVTAVVQLPDLTITLAHAGSFVQGVTGSSYTATVSNTGPGATSGTVTLLGSLASGVTVASMTGTGWTCTATTLTCTRTDALAAGASYPAVTIAVNVGSNAAATVTGSVTVSGGGELNVANDSASDVATTAAPVTLAVTNPAVTVTSGQSVQVPLNVVVNTGVTVAFSCSGLPANASFAFSPSSAGQGTTTVTMTINTATTVGQNRGARALWVILAFPAFGVVLLPAVGRRKRLAFMLLALVVALELVGCGSGSSATGQPTSTLTAAPGTYNVVVTAQGGGIQAQTMVALTIH